jgi:hypothetical protein
MLDPIKNRDSNSRCHLTRLKSVTLGDEIQFQRIWLGFTEPGSLEKHLKVGMGRNLAPDRAVVSRKY